MEHNKTQLQEQIKQMEAVYNDASTPANVKELIKPSIDKAKKLLADLDKPAAPAPAPTATPAEKKEAKTEGKKEEKKVEVKVEKVIETSKKIVRKAKAVSKHKPSSPAHKQTLKSLVAQTKALAELYAGASETSLRKDATRKAMKPGKRKSSSGKVYYESRGNRSDIRKTDPYLATGGPIGTGKNGYIAFYKGKQAEVMADSSYEAQKTAAAHFKAKKSYEVTVVLAEKEGEQVTHTPDFAKGGKTKKGKITPEKWLEEATAYLKKFYLLDPGDMDLDLEKATRAVESGETPQEYIDYYADKHDLTKMGTGFYGFAEGGSIRKDRKANLMIAALYLNAYKNSFKPSQVGYTQTEKIISSFKTKQPDIAMAILSLEAYKKTGQIKDDQQLNHLNIIIKRLQELYPQYAEGGEINKTIWFVTIDDKVKNISTSIEAANGFVKRTGNTGDIHVAVVKTSDWNAEKITVANVKHYEVKGAPGQYAQGGPIGKNATLIPEMFDFRFVVGEYINNEQEAEEYKADLESHANEVGKIISQTGGSYNVKYADKTINVPIEWVQVLETFAKGGKVAKLVKFDSMYDGEVEAYESVDQSDLFYYVSSQDTGPTGSWAIIAEAKGFPATEAFGDWMGKRGDAMEIAKMLAEGKDPSDQDAWLAKGGPLREDPIWNSVGWNRPPGTFTPAAALSFKKAITLLNRENHSSEYYRNAITAMTSLVATVSELLSAESASEAHRLLQLVGIYNYKTGLLVNTDFLNRELAKRKLEYGGEMEYEEDNEGGLPDNYYVYHMHEERGSLQAYVEDKEGNEVWGFRSDDMEEGDSTPVEDGFLRHWDDVAGLEKYLKSLGIIGDDASVISEREAKQKYQHYKKGGKVRRRNLKRDRKFKSKQPWEQKYKRKTRAKKYQKKKTGGEVKFDDKVKAITQSLVGKKVPKKYQGDYGKRYNRKEAGKAARRIAGKMMKDEK